MWKKEDATPIEPRAEVVPTYERPAPPRSSHDRATIGRSITIKGEVKGDEDLLIQGKIDGSVLLKEHAVTVGPEGEVKADIGARVITVEGKVEGNLNAQEQVILRSSARVHGNISAPRVVLEDGARFRGGVDMGESAGVTSAQSDRADGRTAHVTSKSTGGSQRELTDREMAASSGQKDSTAQTGRIAR